MPDYEASRRITVGANEIRLRVHVSGSRVREESDLDGGTQVTIRGLPAGRVVVFNTRSKQGAELPPPIGARSAKRMLDEVQADGSRTRVQQIERGNRWLELSRATCRPDGVMLRQSFVSLDPQGKEVVGSIVQDQIRPGPQPTSLFEVPPEIKISYPGPKDRGPEAPKTR